MIANKSISRIFSVWFVIVFMLVITPLQAVNAAGIRYAKPSASGAGNCSSWANACTLQTALTGALSGDEIWAMAGTHKPTTGTDRTATFQLKNGVALYGGFAGTETARSQRNPAVHVTILSGDIGTLGNNSDNSYHVVTGADGATLDGFTITAGNANYDAPNNTNNSGGGMFNNYSSPTLTNVTFSGNSATNTGGGMFNHNDSSPILTNVTFSGNSAGAGGGMDNFPGGSPTLTNVTFSGNSAEDKGGGMHNNGHSSPTLTNVTFSGNTAYLNGGGGISNEHSSLTLTNVTFSGNSANHGGGISNDIAGNPTIRNTIFWGNTATSDGAQIYNESSTLISVSYSVVQGGCPAGSTCTHILTADPKLGTLGNHGGFTQTIPLLANSSAINMGNDSVCPPTDQRGVTRPQGAHCDIGAYEYPVGPDSIAPVVNSIKRTNPSPTRATSVNFTVTFSEPVTGVNAIDFSLTRTGTLSGLWVTGVSGGLTVYTVSVNTGTGNGTLRLDLKASGTGIQDLAGNPISGGFTGGEAYTIDKTAPTLVSSVRLNANPTKAASVNFTVTFSEPVTGVNAIDFSLTRTGTLTGGSVTGISGGPSIYTVSVNTGTGNGTLRLDLKASGTGIQDLAGNPISGGFTSGNAYTISKTAPVLLTPLNGATLHNYRPVFTWADAEGAISFQLQVSKSNIFSTLLLDLATPASTYTPTANLPVGGLYWRVRAKLSATMYGGWSQVRSFVVANPPSLPTLVSPINNALVASYLPKLDWNNASGAQHYQVEVSKSNTFGTLVVNQSPIVSEYTLTTALAANTTWYWRVRAINEAQSSAWSAVWTFRTKLSKPVAISPVGGVIVSTRKPAFKWNPVSGAAGYTIQVSVSASFTTTLVNAAIPTATASYTPTVNLPAGSTLYWRVRANGANGPSDWMVTATFKTP
jgi:hypothetical protein